MSRLISIVIVLAVGAMTLTGCSRDENQPGGQASAPSERNGPVTWNASSGAFELAGQPLAAAKMWTFDGSTDGFAALDTQLTAAPGKGMTWPVKYPSLRSPKGLAIDGAQNSLVIVRLTRTKGGEMWDAALYYTTEKHGESGQYFAKPINNNSPAVNETVTLVYDMSRLVVGGSDWVESTIDQLRIDIEDKPGGKFVIHQIAITANPNFAALAPVAPSPAASPVTSAPAPPPAPKG